MRTVWYRSLIFWFGLPGIVFLVWAWIDSMHRITAARMSIAGEALYLSNRGGVIQASWGQHYLRSSSKWELKLETRPPRPGYRWFPLPAHISAHNVSNAHGHNLDIPHWFLLLAYTGLWQLPWLGRYYRRKRIGRELEA